MMTDEEIKHKCEDLDTWLRVYKRHERLNADQAVTLCQDICEALKGHIKDINLMRRDNDKIKFKFRVDTLDPKIKGFIRITMKNTYKIEFGNDYTIHMGRRHFRNRDKAIQYLRDFIVGINFLA